jgi:CBS-domain-containing membrane protein
MTYSADPQILRPQPSKPADEALLRARREEELTAADIMSTPVVTISVGDSVWNAWGLLYRSGLRHLVVLDGNRCVGVLDDRRIALEWPRGPGRDLGGRVGELVTGRARCVLPGTPVKDLARLMLRDRADAVPVVDGQGRLIGIVTSRDLLLVLAYRTFNLDLT